MGNGDSSGPIMVQSQSAMIARKNELQLVADMIEKL